MEPQPASTRNNYRVGGKDDRAIGLQLDVQVQPHHAEKLGELARARKKDAGPVEVVHLPGVNHLLVPATTGDIQEYPLLEQKTISPEVATIIAAWLKKSQP